MAYQLASLAAGREDQVFHQYVAGANLVFAEFLEYCGMRWKAILEEFSQEHLDSFPY